MAPKDHTVTIVWDRPPEKIDDKPLSTTDYTHQLIAAGWTKIILTEKIEDSNRPDSWVIIHNWCKDKFGSDSYILGGSSWNTTNISICTFWFKNKEDASYFALMWG